MSKPKTINVAEFLQLMADDHTGRENGITCAALAIKTGILEREVRRLTTQLRMDGYAICAHPGSGYYIAANFVELKMTIAFLRDRGLHHLKIASQLSKMPLADFVGQLKLPT